MKLQIDTVAKTIKVESSEKLIDILSMVKKILPDNWKEYYLQPVEFIFNWNNPIYVPFTYTMPAYQCPTIAPSSFDISCTTVYNIESN